jgi:hypothetical protein
MKIFRKLHNIFAHKHERNFDMQEARLQVDNLQFMAILLSKAELSATEMMCYAKSNPDKYNDGYQRQLAHVSTLKKLYEDRRAEVLSRLPKNYFRKVIKTTQ